MYVKVSTGVPMSDAVCTCVPTATFGPFRSVAQTSLHPANVIKTLLQTKGSFRAILPLTWVTLSRGAGAQFLLSLPNGALHFAVLEVSGQKVCENKQTGFVGRSHMRDVRGGDITCH